MQHELQTGIEFQLELEHQLEAMRKALAIRNYATKTVSTYVSVLRRYLKQLDKPVADVGPADIQAWHSSRRERLAAIISGSICKGGLMTGGGLAIGDRALRSSRAFGLAKGEATTSDPWPEKKAKNCGVPGLCFFN